MNSVSGRTKCCCACVLMLIHAAALAQQRLLLILAARCCDLRSARPLKMSCLILFTLQVSVGLLPEIQLSMDAGAIHQGSQGAALAQCRPDNA